MAPRSGSGGVSLPASGKRVRILPPRPFLAHRFYGAEADQKNFAPSRLSRSISAENRTRIRFPVSIPEIFKVPNRISLFQSKQLSFTRSLPYRCKMCARDPGLRTVDCRLTSTHSSRVGQPEEQTAGSRVHGRGVGAVDCGDRPAIGAPWGRRKIGVGLQYIVAGVRPGEGGVPGGVADL